MHKDRGTAADPIRSTIRDLRAAIRRHPAWREWGEGAGGPGRHLHLNESPYPPPPAVINAICAEASLVNRYPPPNPERLAQKLGSRVGVPASRIVLGAGSDELIYLSALLVLEPGREALVPQPAFPRYTHASRVMGAVARPVPLHPGGYNDVRAALAGVRDGTRLIFLASPNNPTGTAIPAADLTHLARCAPPGVLLVVDEAYHDFSRFAGCPDILNALADCASPWVVIRSFSKSYMMAGLRLGYAVCASDDLAEMLGRVRPVFNVNRLAHAAALAALDEHEYLDARLEECARQRARLVSGLAALGVIPLPSAANFVAADIGRPAAPVVAALERDRILIASIECPGYEHFVRISVGSEPDVDFVLQALAGALQRLPLSRATRAAVETA